MASTNKIIVQIDNEVIELKGDALKEFLEQREIDNANRKALEDERAAQKELKISAYKKLGLTDEEIQAII